MLRTDKPAKYLRAVAASESTPHFVVRWIDYLRQTRDLRSRFLTDPLRRIIGLRHSWREKFAYGNESLVNRRIAEELTFAVQSVVDCHIGGDVAEFGTGTGRTAEVMAAAMASFRHPGWLHLFDSFEGLPGAVSEVDRSSAEVKTGEWSPGSCYGISPRSLRKRVGRHLKQSKIVIHRGWFNKTLPDLGAKLGLVHLDCDLYQSTYEVLDHLFQMRLLAPHAIVLFDDWRFDPNHGQRRAWEYIRNKYHPDWEPLGGYGWRGFKICIHAI